MAQMTSTNRHAGNIAFVQDAARQAKAAGCHLLALPEAAGFLNRNSGDATAHVVGAETDPFILACREMAARHGLWIHTGSTPVTGPDQRFLNHSDLIDTSGQIVASYDKIHLFDVFLEGHRPTGESDRYAAGEQAVLANTPWGVMGMSICYDLRFPQLYRDYARAGARVMFVPSAFTVTTGQAHWEVLLRARAIENAAFVIAAAQVGQHSDGRQTYGHSMVVNPWGEVLADMGDRKTGLAVIDLQLDEVRKARQQIPSLANEQSYSLSWDRPLVVQEAVRE